MENLAAKSREVDDEDDDGDDVGPGSDRISRLPEPVLLHILCFVSQKKAGQTSLLSKSWRHLGPTRPVIELRRSCTPFHSHVRGTNGVCENCLEGNNEDYYSFERNQKVFLSVLENTFQRYRDQNLFPLQLSLQMLKFDSESASVLAKWIPIIFIKPNACLNVFHISFSPRTDFDLPLVVFKVESLRELYLEGCTLNGIINSIDNVVVLKNLQKLSLRDVCLDGETLEKIISGCPLVEHITLFLCKGLVTFNIIANKNHYLRDFEFSCYYAEKDIEHCFKVDAPTLQSIRIFGCSKWYHNHSNYFPSLKSLYLSLVKLPKESFDNFSYNFPCLEELTIHNCWGSNEIKLSSRSIKRLTIQLTMFVKKVAIDAPNIIYFEYSEWYMPATLSLTTTNSTEWKSHLGVSHCGDAYELIEMVKALSQSKISLFISEVFYSKIKQIEWGFNDHPVVVEHLVLNIIRFCTDSLPQLLHALFCIFRPRYTSGRHICRHDGVDKITEFLWKTLIHERETRKYGWEEHLEEVSIEAYDKSGKVWHHVQWTCFPERTKNQKIRFRLKWRDLLDY